MQFDFITKKRYNELKGVEEWIYVTEIPNVIHIIYID